MALGLTLWAAGKGLAAAAERLDEMIEHGHAEAGTYEPPVRIVANEDMWRYAGGYHVQPAPHDRDHAAQARIQRGHT